MSQVLLYATGSSSSILQPWAVPTIIELDVTAPNTPYETFALGLILIMVSITYGIRPYGHHATGWTSPRVIILLSAGLASLIAFVLVERRARDHLRALTA